MEPSSSQHTEREGEIIEIQEEKEGERKTPNHMDPALYKALTNGNVGQLDPNLVWGDQLTPNHNTILHVAAQFGKWECVRAIWEKKPELIQRVNKNGENPLHIAIRNHHNKTVEALISRATTLDLDSESGGGTLLQMLTAKNKDGDMPLHLAVREAWKGDNRLVRLLVDNHGALQQSSNNAGETPLFLAAERSDGDRMVECILACESPAYAGRNGRTALHAAATSGNIESIKKLLGQNMKLIDKADAQGWTPLHIAAAAGHDDVMEEILSHCPDCWEMVNWKGQNILHIALDREAECVIDYIIKMGMLESLMNQEDYDGNTPLHMLASSELKDMEELINRCRANMYAFNNENMTPEIKEDNKRSWFSKARGWRNNGSNEEQAKMTEDFLMERERKESKEVKAENRTSQSHMLVATLIATITFAAGVAIPAGYEASQGSEKGMGALVREAGFKAFFLANTIAVMCSTSSVLCYVFAALYDDDDDEKAECYTLGFFLVLIAVIAMTVGFLSGTYAMLAHILGLAIATFSIAGISVLIYFHKIIRFFIYIKLQKFVANARDTPFHHTNNNTNLSDIV